MARRLGSWSEIESCKHCFRDERIGATTVRHEYVVLGFRTGKGLQGEPVPMVRLRPLGTDEVPQMRIASRYVFITDSGEEIA